KYRLPFHFSYQKAIRRGKRFAGRCCFVLPAHCSRSSTADGRLCSAWCSGGSICRKLTGRVDGCRYHHHIARAVISLSEILLFIFHIKKRYVEESVLPAAAALYCQHIVPVLQQLTGVYVQRGVLAARSFVNGLAV